MANPEDALLVKTPEDVLHQRTPEDALLEPNDAWLKAHAGNAGAEEAALSRRVTKTLTAPLELAGRVLQSPISATIGGVEAARAGGNALDVAKGAAKNAFAGRSTAEFARALEDPETFARALPTLSAIGAGGEAMLPGLHAMLTNPRGAELAT